MDREALLCRVNKPARYLGGEAGCVVKDPAQVRLWFALAFPEVYEIAMSHLGIKILYEALAPRPEVAAERVFMPWLDLMALMEQEGVSPWSLESGRPLERFDVIGFSLQYELTYTNLLQMLRLAGIPLRRQQRGREHPLVIAGGPCLVNPEPVADFLDLGLLGEAEEVIHPLVDLLLEYKQSGMPRAELYRRAARLPGIYAPALYRPRYEGGRLVEVCPDPEAPPRVRKAVVADLSAAPVPTRPVVPAIKPVHDRLGLEIARGCTRGCRFCQAGYIYRPVRERPAGQVLEAALEGLARTGYEELALLSLSSGDYTCIEPLAAALMDSLAQRKVGLSLPSLRVDSLESGLMAHIKKVRKTGFTLAPEAGSQRLREVINKNIDEQQILATARKAFELGWNHLKLYFMLGLPTEEDQDLRELAELCSRVADQAGRKRGRRPLVHASLGLFVPKPHTPFQWQPQMDLAQAKERLDRAKALFGDRRVRVKWNSPLQFVLEGLLSRGDRRLGRVLELAVAKGCCFDGWSEHLRYESWMEALDEAGLALEDYLRAREPQEVLPWDHLDTGVSKHYLRRELDRALEGRATADCRQGACQGCEVCDFKNLRPRTHSEPPPAPRRKPLPAGEPLALRFRLEKTGPARFLGHLETMTQLERAFRRAEIPLAHSRGFHPHPLIKTASALPLGVESLVEVLEVQVHGNPDPHELARRVNRVMPQGLKLADGRRRMPGERLCEPDEVTYLVKSPVPLDPERIVWFQRRESLPYTRRSPKGERVLDLCRAVKHLEIKDGELTLVVGREGGRPKPHEVLEAVFGLTPHEALAARALKVGSACYQPPEDKLANSA